MELGLNPFSSAIAAWNRMDRLQARPDRTSEPEALTEDALPQDAADADMNPYPEIATLTERVLEFMECHGG